MTTKMTTN